MHFSLQVWNVFGKNCYFTLPVTSPALTSLLDVNFVLECVCGGRHIFGSELLAAEEIPRFLFLAHSIF